MRLSFSDQVNRLEEARTSFASPVGIVCLQGAAWKAQPLSVPSYKEQRLNFVRNFITSAENHDRRTRGTRNATSSWAITIVGNIHHLRNVYPVKHPPSWSFTADEKGFRTVSEALMPVLSITTSLSPLSQDSNSVFRREILHDHCEGLILALASCISAFCVHAMSGVSGHLWALTWTFGSDEYAPHRTNWPRKC